MPATVTHRRSLEAAMAEIKVEPKRGGLGWLWAIIILALIAAAVWYFMNNSRAVPATTTPADSTRTSQVVPSVLAEGSRNG
jgi:hypothetical protein